MKFREFTYDNEMEWNKAKNRFRVVRFVSFEKKYDDSINCSWIHYDSYRDSFSRHRIAKFDSNRSA